MADHFWSWLITSWSWQLWHIKDFPVDSSKLPIIMIYPPSCFQRSFRGWILNSITYSKSLRITNPLPSHGWRSSPTHIIHIMDQDAIQDRLELPVSRPPPQKKKNMPVKRTLPGARLCLADWWLRSLIKPLRRNVFKLTTFSTIEALTGFSVMLQQPNSKLTPHRDASAPAQKFRKPHGFCYRVL